MLKHIGIKIFAVALALGSLLALASTSSVAQDYRTERRGIEQERERGRGGNIGTGIGIGIGIGILDGMTRPPPPEAGRPGRAITAGSRKLEVARCYPNFSVKGVVACVSRGASTGASCSAPNACYLYVNGTSTGGASGLYAPPKSAYSCKCE